MNRFSVKLCVLFSLGIIFLFSACASSVNISGDLSPAELIQRAQEASGRNRYNAALQYYQALLDRNRDNIDLIITAEYEIAFIHYKQKKYQQAREELNNVLEYYNTPDEELLPGQFKRLAQIVLESITEKEKPLLPFLKKQG
jgi:outer membrane protein assembly factor BamD (BamD/ComL family)